MITSATNKKIKNVSALLSRTKERRKQKLYVVEGIKMFLEAPQDMLKELYIEETLFQSIKDQTADEDLIKKWNALSMEYEVVSTDVFRKMSDTQTPQGIMCIMQMPDYSFEKMMREKTDTDLYLILEDIQDPGNLGTMLRAGEGAGISGLIMSRNTVDIFNPKTIRATMGSIYRIPFCYVEDLSESINAMKKQNIDVYAAHLQGKAAYDQFEYKQSVAFMIGNEGNGLKDETAKLATAYLKIPMLGKVESLNAAIAATLLMYETARQRRNQE